jgi:UDP-N-acetylglucosamine 2-epimerase
VSRRARVVSVVSSRPEIIQAAPVSAQLRRHVDEVLVHTGQHYDEPLSDAQIRATGLPQPDVRLGVGSRPDLEQVEVGFRRLRAMLDLQRPDVVVVRGDTNGTLSGALAAEAAGIPLVHVEAGLRSHRADMPEERNRIEVDRRAQLLLAPTEDAAQTLADEGVAGEVRVTGDPLADLLLARRDTVVPAPGDYVLATVHRGYNTDDPARLAAVLACLGRAACEVRLPLHPRTRGALGRWGLRVPDNVRLLDPVPYDEMLSLERGARVVATDSGGVQREAYLWGVPCVTLREETEWTGTVTTGWNVLVGVDPDRFAAALERPLPAAHPPILGDGHAAQRIAADVLDLVGAVAA